ncbi:MAG: 50S ribosomal protein L30e [Methanocellales archaeon]|nr:50S ribosomal protein L30e [Methanocellales archaeon]MDD3421411.1 50S ribosomal protein L30e [Methanocellales archaeon]MDD4897844.1 50S ribosomal protein L30e [Methanocellales archaeon]MDD5447316.1 50S ribosomal protein L30e [Methanocellales archaeon]
MNINRALQVVVKTGKVLMGSNETLEAVKKGTAKLVVLASNCPTHVRAEVETKVKTLDYPDTSANLGATCGKPYAIAALAVIDLGESDILAVFR